MKRTLKRTWMILPALLLVFTVACQDLDEVAEDTGINISPVPISNETDIEDENETDIDDEEIEEDYDENVSGIDNETGNVSLNITDNMTDNITDNMTGNESNVSDMNITYPGDNATNNMTNITNASNITSSNDTEDYGINPAEEPTSNETSQNQTGVFGGNNTGNITSVREFDLRGENYKFEPATITVNQGETVRIRFSSDDADHGFSLPQFSVNEIVDEDDTQVFEFVASQAGEFEFVCPVGNHEEQGMVGKLIVN